MAYEGMLAETVNIKGYEGDTIDAYLARPLGKGPFPGVLVIHHMPGWDAGSKEIARRFAATGYAAICPNLHFREGKSTAEENSISVREAGGMPDDRTLGDLAAGIEYLKRLAVSNGRVGIIGYCSGGRQSFLAACRLDGIDAAVNCYGGNVVAEPDQLNERQPAAPIDFAADLSCPLLGLFGNDDQRPSPKDVDMIEEALKRHGKTYEFHRYDDAGHAFFATDRPNNYGPAAAVDGWDRIFDWFARYLAK